MPVQSAVIIPHYNDAVRLDRCLAALTRQDMTGCEVVVVDNGSTEDLAAIRQRFPQVRFVTEPRKGAAHARNRGVQETTAPDLFFLDADCVPAPDWLSVARQAVRRGDLVGGGIDVFDETPPPRSGAEAFETVFAFDYKDYIENKGFSVTANLLTTRAVFLSVGDFIDGLSEDMEWCLRARDKGYRIMLAEDLRVLHPTRSDWPALVRKFRRITQESFELRRTAGDGPALRVKWGLRSLVMLLSAVAHLPKVWRSPRLRGSPEKLRASLMLFRIRALRAGWMAAQALTPPQKRKLRP